MRPTLNQRNGHQNGAHFRNISGQCNMDDSLSKNVTLHLPTCQSSQDAVLQHPLLIVGDVELLHWNTIDICNPTNAPPPLLPYPNLPIKQRWHPATVTYLFDASSLSTGTLFTFAISVVWCTLVMKCKSSSSTCIIRWRQSKPLAINCTW